MEMLIRRIYDPPKLEIIQVILEEGLAQAAVCSPVDPTGIKVEEWGADVTDNYSDIYLIDTW